MSDQPPPKALDGAIVELFAFTKSAQATGVTRHSLISGSVTQILDPGTQFLALAIAKYNEDASAGCYLFYCDANWSVLTDTWHETVEDAIDQANAEFTGLQFEPP
ncbi:hypothetical protein [Nocardia sp. XZ_19_385]|uniref:hypothetical protein n=1 Tax=Nocardia sp. XZ_19_385 TaxID=2769488 RepID=UPI00189079CF|nr:hypothetical protein [Nocardia sp. XZ_19_385]